MKNLATLCIVISSFTSNRNKLCHAFQSSPKVSFRRHYENHMDLLSSSSSSTENESVQVHDEYSVLPELAKPVKERKYTPKPKTKKVKSKTNGGAIAKPLPKYKKLSEIISEQSQKKNNDSSAEDKTLMKNEPWCASYTSSSATQTRIRAASTIKDCDAIDRGTNVLKTLLKTPPEWCNETNVVCALTLSAKCLASSTTQQIVSKQKQNDFRQLLHQTLDILHGMVQHKKLNMRQLANVSWAIAKHYSIDPAILPSKIDNKTKLLYSQNFSFVEKWDLLNEEQDVSKEETSEERVLKTLDEIANTLIDSLSEHFDRTTERSYNDHDNNNDFCYNRGDIKAAEISMICWAYSRIYPRSCPAGWKFPPSLGKMVSGSSDENEDDTVIFEKFDQSALPLLSSFREEDNQQRENLEEPITVVDKLFDIVAQRLILQRSESLLSMTHDMSWKELATIAWAYAHRGFCSTHPSVTLLSQIANEAIYRLQNLEHESEKKSPSSRDISEIAWALGVSQTDNHVLSNILDEYIGVISSTFVNLNEARPLKEWTSADCVQLAVAMAHGRLDDPELLGHIYYEATHSLKDELEISSTLIRSNKRFQSWELSVLLWVQARLYLTDEVGNGFDEYADIVPRVLLSRITKSHGQIRNQSESLKDMFASISLSAQEKANLCWSLTVLDKVKSPHAKQLVQAIFRDAALSCSNGEQIRLEHAHQLWQSIFLLDFPKDEIVTEEFTSFLRQTWDKEKSRRKASSARHRALSQTLDFMGVLHYNEHDEDIDVAIVLKTESKWLHTASKCDHSDYDTRVAVEFDGPAHFTRERCFSKNQLTKGDTPRALGHTVLKYRLLKKQGWTVIRVPYYEFDRIPFWASMERQRYLQRKLKTHANIRFSGIDVSEYKAHVPNKQSRFD